MFKRVNVTYSFIKRKIPTLYIHIDFLVKG